MADKLCANCGQWMTELDDGLYQCEHCGHFHDTSYWQRGMDALAAEGKTLEDMYREITQHIEAPNGGDER